MRAGLAVAFLLAVVPSPALGQGCEAGRVVVEGYCCWPGQTWSDFAQRCSGPPICPTGFVGAGAECIPVAYPTATPDYRPVVVPVPVAAPRRAEPTSRRDFGLLAGGGVLFLGTYVATVLTFTFVGQTRTGSSGYPYYSYRPTAPWWPLSLIPIFHVFGMIDNQGGGGAVALWVLSFLAGLAEIGATVMLIIGDRGLNHHESDATVRLDPSAPGADAGVSLRVDF